ncbi:MAG: bifunctional hydroxymethylpyrimidine kinase/phosphomethylpyrimidine kinase [Coriobacteriia bacterium]|nr:bifunctional hydroxymethylpyrimidine kinase/phosphomethylpyrimidine kinase [Coriobacteriia bacterium]
MRCALTIAGSDSSGGAGIQADIKTMSALGVYAESVITALTAQNTLGVQGVEPISPDFVRAQIDSVFTDIRPGAVKIGMLANAQIVHAVAAGLKAHGAHNIVVDPVMVATSGDALTEDSSVAALDELLGIATLATPNIPEAEVLSGMQIHCKEDMATAAKHICTSKACPAVLMKGGHLDKAADDVLVTASGEEIWFSHERIATENTHGTGCTLSSAIASYLALGEKLPDAIKLAKEYLTGALANDPHLGHGHGPVNHLWMMSRTQC